jgi:hypothetical protein
MTDSLLCDLVTNTIHGTIKIESSDKSEFIEQYRLALEETRGVSGVVYVLKTGGAIPRFKGASNILYIGETKHDVWSRYYVEEDTNEFWPVYNHAVNNYGAIVVDVYVSSDHKSTEKKFLTQYYDTHNELPPINRRF